MIRIANHLHRVLKDLQDINKLSVLNEKKKKDNATSAEIDKSKTLKISSKGF